MNNGITELTCKCPVCGSVEYTYIDVDDERNEICQCDECTSTFALTYGVVAISLVADNRNTFIMNNTKNALLENLNILDASDPRMRYLIDELRATLDNMDSAEHEQLYRTGK